MKICYLAHAQSIHTQRWVNFFAERGHEVHLISMEKSCIEGVKFHYIKPIIPYPTLDHFILPIELLRVKRLLKKINPDVLHAHYLTSYGFLGALTGFKPLVVSAWGSDILINPKKSKLKKYIAKCVVRKADLITGDAMCLLFEIIKLGATQEEIKLINHGVDLMKFCPDVKDNKLKERLSIPVDSSVVISGRSLEPDYSVETLIRAAHYILKKQSDTYFIIVGEGWLKKNLQMMAKKLKVLNHLKFIGKVSHEEVPAYLTTSDIYVSTSLSDSVSVMLTEAMACQLPVIVTDLEGNKELIKDGVNGLLVPKRDPRTLAEKIVYLLRNQDVRAKFGVINRKIVNERACYEKEMSKMEKLYEDLVTRYRR